MDTIRAVSAETIDGKKQLIYANVKSVDHPELLKLQTRVGKLPYTPPHTNAGFKGFEFD